MALGARSRRRTARASSCSPTAWCGTRSAIRCPARWSTPGRPTAAACIRFRRQGQDPMDLRGRFTTDDEGRYYYTTVLPKPYTVPYDGPVGELLRAGDRHAWRSKHLHYMVGAPKHARDRHRGLLRGRRVHRFRCGVRRAPVADRQGSAACPPTPISNTISSASPTRASTSTSSSPRPRPEGLQLRSAAIDIVGGTERLRMHSLYRARRGLYDPGHVGLREAATTRINALAGARVEGGQR